ncbi:MAG: sensor histidine kinase [Campylobacterales bacterium]|nr:sensor histidine kinase [Campylobacterales bacterium]
MSIKYKILLPLLVMVVFVVSTINYLYTRYVEEYITKSSLQQLEVIGSITEDKIDLYIQQMRDKLELFNTRMYLFEKLKEYDEFHNLQIQHIVSNILKFSYASEKDIVDIVILDSQFKIIASKLDTIDAENNFIKRLLEANRHTPMTKLEYVSDKKMPLMYISSPILDKNRLIGTSIFVIKLSYLNSLLTNDVEIGKTGEIFMGSKNGNKLILFTPLKFSHYPMYCTNSDFNNYISHQIMSADTKHQTLKDALDYRKARVVLSLHYNKVLESVIVVKKDIQELMEPIEEIKKYQLIIVSVGILFIIGLSLLISNKIIKTIRSIVRITSKISNGKFDERIGNHGSDELGQLAQSVNKMANFMINANQIAEAKVVEQTKLLQESNDKLQNHNENLSTVIKSLSHDIRTPLTIINGYLEELDDGIVKYNDIPKVTEILKRETAYINELSTEVIDYIQSSDLKLNNKEMIILNYFLEQEVCPLIRTPKNVRLICEVSTNNLVYFNKTALKKILVNLLHNASKYTSEGYIVIKSSVDTIIVEDSGVGISKKYSQMVFEPFYSIDQSRNRDKNGFGLGLSIAKNLAYKNGYNLYLDTTYSEGARFILEPIWESSRLED